MLSVIELRYSATQSLLNCQRRFVYDYVYEIERIDSSDNITLATCGTAFHIAAAELLRGGDGLGALQQAFLELSFGNSLVKVGTKMVNAQEVTTGMWNRYYQWVKHTEPFSGYSLIMTEKRLSMPVGEDCIINGEPDYVLQNDRTGALRLGDWKTTARFSTQENILERSRQLLTYTNLVEYNLDAQVESVEYLQIHRSPPAKNPLPINLIVMWPNLEQKLNNLNHLQTILQTAQQLQVHSTQAVPNPGDQCSYCPFNQLCLLQDTDIESAKIYKTTEFRKKEVNA